MSKEVIKKIINDYLTKFGAINIELVDSDEKTIVALFNADGLISLKEPIPGWQYTGIQFDSSGKYKMIFSQQ